ncbi:MULTISPECIES: hypothetical protein [unclassified Frankia]|nr:MULTISPECIES: hypothetical protein [unclassified Frankia]MBL7487529.1 hypothetical protein [Frankia sp. AgW1.1]MBL7620711.1 hypothetical protein [Frankia sp. AgB1.8]
MTQALGIHAHPDRKLGRRPNDAAKPRLLFAEFVAAAPAHPVADPAPDLSWPMDGNDQFGDCVVAGSDHALQAIYTTLAGSYTNWTSDQIVAFYRTQNPDFDPETGSGDGGMVIQDFLSYLVKQGVILGFAAIDPHNEDEVKAAVYLGLAIVTGEDLDVAQQTQTIWDHVAGSAEWGGHCTVWVGYPGSPDYDTCVSWGQEVQMTQRFVTSQVSEAWFIVTQAHVDHPAFRAGFDLASFAAAYTAMTGRPFPVDVPPGPTPTPPTPTPPTPVPPTPPADADAELWQSVRSWANGRHVGSAKKAASALTAWAHAKGYS